MFKYAAILALVASPLAAKDKVTNAYVEDHYSTYYEFVPEYERVCETIDVPVYGTKKRKATGGEVLGGMVLGGLLGGTASGKDEGAAIGALIGGALVNESAKEEKYIKGYRQEQSCNTVETQKKVTQVQYDYSVLTFTIDGVTYTHTFYR